MSQVGFLQSSAAFRMASGYALVAAEEGAAIGLGEVAAGLVFTPVGTNKYLILFVDVQIQSSIYRIELFRFQTWFTSARGRGRGSPLQRHPASYTVRHHTRRRPHCLDAFLLACLLAPGLYLPGRSGSRIMAGSNNRDFSGTSRPALAAHGHDGLSSEEINSGHGCT